MMVISNLFGKFFTSNSSAQLWKLGRLNHIAIAVPDLRRTSEFYCNILGADVSEPVDLPEHGVTTVFVNLCNTKLELLKPLGDNSPIKGFLEKNKNGGLHHICLEVDNLEIAYKQIQSSKIRCLSSEPQIGAHNKPIIFLHPKDCGGVLIELEQA